MGQRSNVASQKSNRLEYIYIPGCIHIDDITDDDKMAIWAESAKFQNLKINFEREITKVSQKYMKEKKEKMILAIIGTIASCIGTYFISIDSKIIFILLAGIFGWSLCSAIELLWAALKMNKVIRRLKKEYINTNRKC